MTAIQAAKEALEEAELDLAGLQNSRHLTSWLKTGAVAVAKDRVNRLRANLNALLIADGVDE